MAVENRVSSPKAGWKRISLSARGVLIMLLPMAALFAVFAAVYRVEGDLQDADQIAARHFDALAQLQQLRSREETAAGAAQAYLLTRRPEFLQDYQTAHRPVEEALLRISRLIPSSESAALGGVADSVRMQLEILDEIVGGPGDDAEPGLLDRSRKARADIESRLSLLADAEDQAISRARSKRQAERSKLFLIIAVCGFFGPLGALLLHLLIARRLIGRVQVLEQNARSLADGTALETLPEGDDEIAAVDRAIRDAALLLRNRERELRESELRYRNLFDQAPLPFEETDSEGVIRRVNQAACALLKATPEQILGLPAWHFLAPGLHESFRQAMLARIRSATEIAPYEAAYLLSDGSSINVEIRESLLRSERGEVIGLGRSLLDITERNLAEIAARKVAQYAMELRNKNEQLAQALETARSAAEAKGRFLASMSHELRTPLNAIIGFSEMLFDGKLGPLPSDHLDCLQDILTSARHLLRLISDILDLSKIEAGRMEFCPEPCLLDGLVSEVRDVIRPLADKKRIELLLSVPPDLHVILDASRFKQVLYNYLSNAVKFTPEGGWITVRVLPEDTHFRLEVEDTGIGIPEDEISKLFQEFQQLPNSRKAEQGTGLGLALTRRIVEAQGGTVSVRSTPGMGSTFSAILPLQPADHMAPLARVS
jgi:PAS domain S-box-containing protein